VTYEIEGLYPQEIPLNDPGDHVYEIDGSFDSAVDPFDFDDDWYRVILPKDTLVSVSTDSAMHLVDIYGIYDGDYPYPGGSAGSAGLITEFTPEMTEPYDFFLRNGLTGPYTFTITLGGQRTPTDDVDVTLTSSIPDGSSVFGQSITYTATVSARPPATGLPTGNVTFNYVDATGQPQSATFDLGQGVPSITINNLPVGTNTITAVYSGDSQFKGGSAQFSQVVGPCPTFVDTRDVRFVYGQAASVDAIVTPLVQPPPVPPSGDLTLLYNTAVIGTVFFNGVGNSIPISPNLDAGVYHLTLEYEGDTNFKPSDIGVTVTIDKAPLKVQATNIDVDRDQTIPAAGVQYIGFVNGDTEAGLRNTGKLRGNPKVSISPNAGNAAGRYPIHVEPGDLKADNYEITTVDGELTVHPVVRDVRVWYGKGSMSILNLQRDLPFVNIQAVSVIFSDPVVVDQAALALTSKLTPGRTYGTNGFRYDSATRTARWTLPAAFGVDRLSLDLDGDDATTDHHNGVRVAPDIYLGDYSLGFSVLPGDYNGDRVVNSLDYLGILHEIFDAPFPNMAIWADLNGDNVVNRADYRLALKNVGKRL
jgi:hypothetical protein